MFIELHSRRHEEVATTGTGFEECKEYCLSTESCGYFTVVGDLNDEFYDNHCYMFDATVGCPEIADEPFDGDRTCETMGCITGVPCSNV